MGPGFRLQQSLLKFTLHMEHPEITALSMECYEKWVGRTLLYELITIQLIEIKIASKVFGMNCCDEIPSWQGSNTNQNVKDELDRLGKDA